jgi:RNA recognition motif-containing protein
MTMSQNLFVGNLSFRTTAADLRKAFGHFGTVTRAEIVAALGPWSRDFGVVEMADGGDEAIATLNGLQFQGRVLTVTEIGAAPGTPRATGHPTEEIRHRMEERVAHHAAGGPGVGDRLGQLDGEQNVERGGYRTTAEIDEERHTLQALRGDFGYLRPLTAAVERADVARFEGEGGRATGPAADSAHDEQDDAAVAEALRTARH